MSSNSLRRTCPFCGNSVHLGFNTCSSCGANYRRRLSLRRAFELLVFISMPILAGTWLAHDALKNHQAVKPLLDAIFGAPPTGSGVEVGDFYFFRWLKISFALWLVFFALAVIRMRQFAWFRVQN